MPLLSVVGGDPSKAGWLMRSPQAAAFVSLCYRGSVLSLGPCMWESLPSPSLFSVTLFLPLSFEVLYLWPAASQPTPGTLQDEEMPLGCSEASGQEALLPLLPRTGRPQPQACRLPPNPSPKPLHSSGILTSSQGQEYQNEGP